MTTISRVTISDIARKAGLSKGAVSYALNNKPGVSADTRQRVKAIADELGWRASQAARSLSRSRADAVGLVLTRPAKLLGMEPFYMEFIAGIEGVISRAGTALMLHVVDSVESEIEIYERWWAQRRVDGIILVDMTANDPRVEAIHRIGIPTVYVRDPQGDDADIHIWTDDARAMREAVQYLVRLGHTRIARVAGLPSFTHIAIRNETLQEVAAELGVPAPTVIDTDFSGEAGARATRAMLSSRNPPTAIIYDNDIMAVAGLGVASELGIDVPGELSLLAWDDSSLCQITHPPLSAMHRDVAALGSAAASVLLELIAGEGATSREGSPAILFARGSTARSPID